jgi:hypothetical protein
MTDADTDQRFIILEIVDAVGNRLTQLLAGKVVCIDVKGLFAGRSTRPEFLRFPGTSCNEVLPSQFSGQWTEVTALWKIWLRFVPLEVF